jgi:hypothetical protein
MCPSPRPGRLESASWAAAAKRGGEAGKDVQVDCEHVESLISHLAAQSFAPSRVGVDSLDDHLSMFKAVDECRLSVSSRFANHVGTGMDARSGGS